MPCSFARPTVDLPLSTPEVFLALKLMGVEGSVIFPLSAQSSILAKSTERVLSVSAPGSPLCIWKCQGKAGHYKVLVVSHGEVYLCLLRSSTGVVTDVRVAWQPRHDCCASQGRASLSVSSLSMIVGGRLFGTKPGISRSVDRVRCSADFCQQHFEPELWSWCCAVSAATSFWA